jgi:hypothetical protein
MTEETKTRGRGRPAGSTNKTIGINPALAAEITDVSQETGMPISAVRALISRNMSKVYLGKVGEVVVLEIQGQLNAKKDRTENAS